MRLTQKRLQILLDLATRAQDDLLADADTIVGELTNREIREMEEAIHAGYALLRRRMKKADAR
jgi:hypothetical protein